MGFRTTFVSEHIYIDLPKWFTDKWADNTHFYVRPEGLYGGGAGNLTLPISSKFERKFYGSKEDELFTDLQRVLVELKDEPNVKEIEIVLFHECNGITKVKISKDEIKMFEPSEWHEVDEIEHNYCYGCSEPPTPAKKGSE
jgi:hypothetical protein